MLPTLFGGRVRADTLRALAGTSRPLTAYRLAKIVAAEPIQVLSILKSLQPELAERTSAGWILVNEPLRQFLRDQSARHEAEIRKEKDAILERMGMKTRGIRERR